MPEEKFNDHPASVKVARDQHNEFPSSIQHSRSELVVKIGPYPNLSGFYTLVEMFPRRGSTSAALYCVI